MTMQRLAVAHLPLRLQLSCSLSLPRTRYFAPPEVYMDSDGNTVTVEQDLKDDAAKRGQVPIPPDEVSKRSVPCSGTSNRLGGYKSEGK